MLALCFPQKGGVRLYYLHTYNKAQIIPRTCMNDHGSRKIHVKCWFWKGSHWGLNEMLHLISWKVGIWSVCSLLDGTGGSPCSLYLIKGEDITTCQHILCESINAIKHQYSASLCRRLQSPWIRYIISSTIPPASWMTMKSLCTGIIQLYWSYPKGVYGTRIGLLIQKIKFDLPYGTTWLYLMLNGRPSLSLRTDRLLPKNVWSDSDLSWPLDVSRSLTSVTHAATYLCNACLPRNVGPSLGTNLTYISQPGVAEMDENMAYASSHGIVAHLENKKQISAFTWPLFHSWNRSIWKDVKQITCGSRLFDLFKEDITCWFITGIRWDP